MTNKTILILTIAAIIVAGTLTSGTAFAKEQPNGQPFQALWDEIAKIQDKLTGLQDQIDMILVPSGETLNHYQVKQVDNTSNVVMALCDAGDTLTGGGGFGDGDEAIGSPQPLIGSGPTQQGDQSGWIVLTPLNLNKGATAIAICADTVEPFR